MCGTGFSSSPLVESAAVLLLGAPFTLFGGADCTTLGHGCFPSHFLWMVLLFSLFPCGGAAFSPLLSVVLLPLHLLLLGGSAVPHSLWVVLPPYLLSLFPCGGAAFSTLPSVVLLPFLLSPSGWCFPPSMPSLEWSWCPPSSLWVVLVFFLRFFFWVIVIYCYCWVVLRAFPALPFWVVLPFPLLAGGGAFSLVHIFLFIKLFLDNYNL